jgi:hypothetical protein
MLDATMRTDRDSTAELATQGGENTGIEPVSEV